MCTLLRTIVNGVFGSPRKLCMLVSLAFTKSMIYCVHLNESSQVHEVLIHPTARYYIFRKLMLT